MVTIATPGAALDPVALDHSGSRPGRLASWLLRQLLRHPIPTYLATSTIAFVIIFLVTYTPPHAHASTSIAHIFASNLRATVVASVLALLLEPSIILLCLFKTERIMISIARQAAREGQQPILQLVPDTLDRINVQLRELHGMGAELEPYEVANWVRRCFETTRSNVYIGTDSHIPSEYEDIYNDYLSAHSHYNQAHPDARSTRIMVVEMERLRTDRVDNQDSYEFFRRWHSEENVTLKQVDPGLSQHLLEADDRLKNLVGTDIGMWEGDFVLLFNPVKRGGKEKVRLRLSYAGSPQYEMCTNYMIALDQHLKDLGEELPFYSDSLSESWELFCNPDERVKLTGPFLDSIIARIRRDRSEIRIFDAAAGIGIETVYLIKQGYFVTTNEIENSLRAKASQYADRHDARINPAQFSKSDWLRLDQDHGERQYDLVLVLGNSLCHLDGPEQLKKAISQFQRLLRPGGVLVCDERNFAYIDENWAQISRDPWNEFRFNKRARKVMYHGEDVLGTPTENVRNREKTGSRYIFEYRHVHRDHENRDRIVPDDLLGTLSMYSFRREEMMKILKTTRTSPGVGGKSAFETIEMYSDLQPTESLDGKADFFTYAAWVAPGPRETPTATGEENRLTAPSAK